MNGWRDLGTLFLAETYEVLHACPACGAVVCGVDIDAHEQWHKSMEAKP